MFLTTPANGVEDRSVSLIVKPPVTAPFLSGVQLLARYHNFTSQRGDAGLGHEGDLQATAALTRRLSALLGYADYRGVTGFASRHKIYASLDFKL